MPSQGSATSQGPAAAPDGVSLGVFPSSGHAAAGRHTVPWGVLASAGQLMLVPVQVSAGSQTPADGRHSAPAFPAGCWHFMLTPSQTSAVHGLASSAHVTPAALHVSAGHCGPFPEQVSATSHSPAAARHTVLAEAKPSAGRPLVGPSHVSPAAQGAAAGRHALPAACFASAGQVALAPVQASGTSHTPPAVRQTVPEPTNVQLALQQAPPSHCSPWSTTPLPQFSL